MRKTIASLTLAALLALAGCSSNDRGDSAAEKPAGAAPEAPAQQPPAQKTDASVGTSGRAIVYKGALTVQVDDVRATAKRIATLLPAEGYVDSENTSDTRAQFTVRVPAKGFAEFLDKAAGLGRELSRTTNTEDVTQAVLDLETRIASQKASVAAAQRMYAQARTLQDIVAMDREVRTREAELAELVAKRDRLADLVALSTVTITLVDPQTEVKEPEQELPGFLGGLKEGWEAFTATVQAGLTILGFALPFLIAIALPIAAYLFWRRRRRQAPTE